MTDNIVLSGSLLFLSVADVFQLLGSNNCTGILTVRSQYSPDKGVIFLIGGSPADASCGDLKGVEAIYALFGWTEGRYEFAEQKLTGMEPVIRQSMMEIVLDALRLMDEGKIVRVGPAPPSYQDKEKPAGDDSTLDFVHTLTGPMVDYINVTGDFSYADGATIVKEGVYGKWLWVIYEGTVKITRETSKGRLTLARLGRGCFIGTIRSLLSGEYERSATAIAEGNVQLCILDAEALHQEYSALSPDFKKILLSLDNRLRRINENAVQAYIGGQAKPLPEEKVREDRFQSTDLYIIREGTADIIGKGPGGDVNLLSLGRDDIFGQIPFMAFGHEPLAASVMTSKDSFAADLLDSDALQKEYDHLSHTFRNFVFSTATNISMTTKLYYQLLNKI